MLDPNGFWSYTTSDDKASRGRLSQLRQSLADALQQKIGRKSQVSIFQDKATIPYGTNWEGEIRHALDRSSFFIPIVTPAFLQSEWCSREIKHFSKRQASLGRDDLIFPIHYTDVTAFDNLRKGECYDPEVLDLLHTHQWADFLTLRLRSSKSTKIAQKLDAIADAICGALFRGISKSKASLPVGHIPEMVAVPQGTFTMGIPAAESQKHYKDGTNDARDDAGRPCHIVTFVRGFHIGEIPGDTGPGPAFVASTGYQTTVDWRQPDFAQTDRDPVVNVNALDAEAYVEWLSAMTGGTFRLPSEAEWEFAARAGTATSRFWGDGWENAPDYLKIRGRGTSPAGSFKPNPLGLFDMLGNTWEWCADGWHDNYDGAPIDGSAWTSDTNPKRRVLRGGSWNSLPDNVRVGYRNWGVARYRANHLGSPRGQ